MQLEPWPPKTVFYSIRPLSIIILYPGYTKIRITLSKIESGRILIYRKPEENFMRTCKLILNCINIDFTLTILVHKTLPICEVDKY